MPGSRRRKLKRLQPIHHRAMELRLMGQTYRQIAAAVNRSPATVKMWFWDDPLFQAAYRDLQAEVADRARARLVSLTEQAVERLAQLLARASPPIALAAARDVLDRVGLTAPRRVEHVGDQGGPIVIRWEDGTVADLG